MTSATSEVKYLRFTTIWYVTSFLETLIFEQVMLASMASLRLFEVINQNYDLGGQLQTIWIVCNFTGTLQIMLASMASEAFRG